MSNKASFRTLALVGLASAGCLVLLTLGVTIGVALIVQWLVTTVWHRSMEEVGGQAFILVVLPVAMLGGAVWGRIVGPLVGVASRALAWRAGAAYGLAFPTVLALLGTFEGHITEHGAREATSIPNIHLFFVAAWSLGMAGFIGPLGLALGMALRSEALALKLALMSGLSGTASFIVLDAIMYAANWRVGHPDFPERPTMSVVVGLGMLTALLVSGMVQAWLVTRTDHQGVPTAWTASEVGGRSGP
ncbi:MAG: hypothetical protein KIT87_02300 [Anaerolineae bacterium]|nr:hypothetical protein [Anaerolineae bacterium]